MELEKWGRSLPEGEHFQAQGPSAESSEKMNGVKNVLRVMSTRHEEWLRSVSNEKGCSPTLSA